MLLEINEKGIYCPAGQFYIDPWKPVEKAVITHAHSDHARWGHGHYLAHPFSEPIMRLRLGAEINVQAVRYGEKVFINGVQVSFHPAGHIPGSAQVRVEHKGEVWVVSGDYKREEDGVSTPFEVVPCHTFITECTFGMPIYKWMPQQTIYDEVNAWWAKNRAEGKISVLFAYALGKAQRLISGLDGQIGPIFAHGAIWNTLEAMQAFFQPPCPIRKVGEPYTKADYAGGLVIAPPSALGSPWMRKFQPFATGMASGWMAVRGMKRRRAMDQGFILSDHADWPALLQTVKDTGAERILATHGYTNSFSRYLREQGWDAQPVETLFEGENVDAAPEPNEAAH